MKIKARVIGKFGAPVIFGEVDGVDQTIHGANLVGLQNYLDINEDAIVVKQKLASVRRFCFSQHDKLIENVHVIMIEGYPAWYFAKDFQFLIV